MTKKERNKEKEHEKLGRRKKLNTFSDSIHLWLKWRHDMWLCCSLKRCTLGNHERSLCVISQTPPMTHYNLLWSFKWKENRKDFQVRERRCNVQAGIQSHDTHILHYTNRLRAHTHTHTLKCAHDTHRWGVEGFQKCMMGHRNREPWHPEEHKGGLPTSGSGEGGDGVKGWGWMEGCRQHAQTERRCTEHWAWAVRPSQTRWKRRRDILKGDVRLARRWTGDAISVAYLFFAFFFFWISARQGVITTELWASECWKFWRTHLSRCIQVD